LFHFLNDKERKKQKIFVLIFKFILIYLLHVLFVLKIEGIFEEKKSSPKVLKWVVFLIYSIDSKVLTTCVICIEN